MRTALLSLLLALGAACASPGGAVDPAGIEPCRPRGLVSVGDPLPDCDFEGVGDDPGVSLAALRGTPAVLNFWASWCASCIREMPDFQTVWEDLGREVHIIGMNTLGLQGETRAAAETFSRDRGVRYPLAYDDQGWLYAHFGERLKPFLPLTVFADADGIVRYRHTGELTEQTLRDLISEHLDVG